MSPTISVYVPSRPPWKSWRMENAKSNDEAPPPPNDSEVTTRTSASALLAGSETSSDAAPVARSVVSIVGAGPAMSSRSPFDSTGPLSKSAQYVGVGVSVLQGPSTMRVASGAASVGAASVDDVGGAPSVTGPASTPPASVPPTPSPPLEKSEVDQK